MSTWTHIQCPLTLELACTLTVLNGGMVTFHVVQTGPLTSSRQNSSPLWAQPLGRNGLPPFPPQFQLSLFEVAAVTKKWQLQNELVSTSWLPLWAPPWLSCLWPYLWFWIQPWLGPSQNRSWLVWPTTAHSHCSSWSLGSEDWPPQT